MMKRLADHCGAELTKCADHDPRVWVLDGDLADSDGAITFAQGHPDRFLMAGIAEQSMVSVGAGMAAAGLKPWVFSFAAFLCYRAYDQIRVCLSQARQPVVLVGSHAGGLSGRNGKTHSALNDLALMLSLPEVQVWSPGDLPDVSVVVQTLLDQPAPAYIRLPRCPVDVRQPLPGEAAAYRWLTPLRPVTIVSTGLASHWAFDAVRILGSRGVEAGLLHCLSLKPAAPLLSLLRTVEHIFVVEDGYSFGGLATMIRELELPARLDAIGWPSSFSGKSAANDDELLEHYGLSGSKLAEKILTRLAHRCPLPETTRTGRSAAKEI